ncbi:MAG: N-glycosylase/DNA lyase [Candidatus Micrarchaeota archaeon]
MGEDMQQGKKKLIEEIRSTRKRIRGKVKERMDELRNNKDWFSELCFCILTANYTAEGGVKIQNAVNDFSKLPLKQIQGKLRTYGHRFPNARANYILVARKHKGKLNALCEMKNSNERREWLVANVKGLGYKEASHFLRNIGFFDVAIIDRHILNVLEEYGIIKKPKTMARKRYLEIEGTLREIASELRVSLGELDFYMWYMKTGKVLK